MPRKEAIQFFRDIGEHYKSEIIESIPQSESVSLYKQGNFVDLCRGPHVPSTGKAQSVQVDEGCGSLLAR